MRNFIALLLTALAFAGCAPTKRFESEKAFSRNCVGKKKAPKHQNLNARVFNAQYPPSK